MNDVVYILKTDIEADELKYSLRSVEKNIPYRMVWTFGGCPQGIYPDKAVIVDQVGKTKWERATNTLRIVCENKEVSDDFWLFNDDFFIMKKISKLQPMVRGTLRDRCESIEKKYGYLTRYGRQLANAEAALIEKGYDTLDYTIHAPMLINKETCIKCLDTFPDNPMFRSLYGNFAKVGGVLTDDVKIIALDQDPAGDELLLSTSDGSFREGSVGIYIRSMFRDKSRYEYADRL